MLAVVVDTNSHFLIFKLQLEHLIMAVSGASGILGFAINANVDLLYFQGQYSTGDVALGLFIWF